MYRIWLLFDPRRALVALVRVPVRARADHSLHPAQHGSVQLAGRPPGQGGQVEQTPVTMIVTGVG